MLFSLSNPSVGRWATRYILNSALLETGYLTPLHEFHWQFWRRPARTKACQRILLRQFSPAPPPLWTILLLISLMQYYGHDLYIGQKQKK